MPVAKVYSMVVKPGSEQRLKDILLSFAANARNIAGCGGLELLEHSDKPGTFLFIEKYDSVEAHAVARGNVDEGALKPLREAVAEASGQYYEQHS